MRSSEPVETLFRQLTLLLKRHRFKRESDEAGFKIFGRKNGESVERIGILTRTTGGRDYEIALSVVMGIEFANLESERFWIGMPRTHGSVELRLLNKAAKKEFLVTEDSDMKGCATQLVDLIVGAGEELQRRSEKLRKAYISLVEARGSNTRKRLAIFAERKAKEQKKKTPAAKQSAKLAEITSVNSFEIACSLLRTNKDQVQVVECYEFDEAGTHDRSLTQRIQQQFVERAEGIETELAEILDAPQETGTSEHEKLPVNGVRYFAFWNVGWRILYVVVSHEDVGLPCYLLMGSKPRNYQ